MTIRAKQIYEYHLTSVVLYLHLFQERDFSITLTAAFAFADSLTHGACGHNPIELDLASWNTLIKACVYRGAIMRALDILNETMPKNNIEPDAFSYNSILAGLARLVSIIGAFMNTFHVDSDIISIFQLNQSRFFSLQQKGDKDFMREILLTMTNKQIPANKYTVQVRKRNSSYWCQ